jgi:hypothetical protein
LYDGKKNDEHGHAAQGSVFVGGRPRAGWLCEWAEAPLSMGGYQTQVYQYLKDGAKEEQVLALESGLDKMKAKGGSAPPGITPSLACCI